MKAGETMNVKCTAVVVKEANWFVATCVENNIASQGRTIDEAVENLKEAVALYYEDVKGIPEPSIVYFTTFEVAI